MEFCPNCGGMMLPFEVEIVIEDEEERGYPYEEGIVKERYFGGYFYPDTIIKKYLKCNRCGYEKELSEETKEEYSVDKKVKTADTVIIRADETLLNSTVRGICPKCGHDRAFSQLVQIHGIAEGPTSFFTCEKCHHKWRGK